MGQHVVLASATPTTSPTGYGQHWIDVTSGRLWIAIGVESVDDWRELLLVTDKVRQGADGRLEQANDDSGLFHGTGLRNNPDGMVERYEDETGIA